MEPLTAVGAGLAVLGSKELLIKILGPTADYLGDEIQGFVQKCNVNLDNIFVKAGKKLGDRLDDEGKVNPRVLKHILDEGRFCEDGITAEYYAGILAASKSESDDDDRGVPVLKQLESMSSYQIYLHYTFYFQLQSTFKNSKFNIGLSYDCGEMELYFSFESLRKAMTLKDSVEGWNVVVHGVRGLYQLGLIDDYKYGRVEHLKEHYNDVPENGFILKPNLSGAELFLWGAGLKGYTGHELFELDHDFSLETSPLDILCEIVR